MTTPEIPEEAVEAAARAIAPHWFDRDCPGPEREIRQQASRALAAALPHLRVQETPGLREALEASLADMPVMTHSNGYPVQALPKAELLGILALQRLPAPHPRPVVDREALRDRIAEALAEKWTQPLDITNRREDWTYPERPMSERVHDEVSSSYRSGSLEDPSWVMRSPTCVEIADAVLALLPTEEETKALAEVATKLGEAIGRKAAGEEIERAINIARIERRWSSVALAAGGECMAIAREVTSQPQEAPSEPLTASTSHSDLPEGGEGL